MGARRIVAGIALPVLAATGLTVGMQGVASAAPQSKNVHIVAVGHPATAAQTAQLEAAASSGHGCDGSEVSNNTYVHICYVRDGDTLWVHDDEPNGRYAKGYIEAPAHGTVVSEVCLDPYTWAEDRWFGCSFPGFDENVYAYYCGFDVLANGSSPAHKTPVMRELTN